MNYYVRVHGTYGTKYFLYRNKLISGDGEKPATAKYMAVSRD